MDGFGWMFALFPIFFIAVFAFVIITFIVTFVRGIGQWNRNNHSPQLTVEATVVTKRVNVSHTQHANAGDHTGAHGYHTSSSTSYYVTFQVESGDRMEFAVDGMEYGILVEGDRGRLTFQGTRYLGFERSRG